MSIISKSEFARRRNFSPQRVSQLLASGKISGKAIVGEGRSAKIVEEIAVEQLARRLDTGQRVGNGVETKLAAPDDDADNERSSELADRLLRAKTRTAEIAVQRREEEELLRRGIFTLTTDARAGLSRGFGELLTAFESALPEIANTAAAAAAGGASSREIVIAIKTKWMEIRGRLASTYAARAAKLPKTIEWKGHEPSQPAA
jgi:hypothetical protein